MSKDPASQQPTRVERGRRVRSRTFAVRGSVTPASPVGCSARALGAVVGLTPFRPPDRFSLLDLSPSTCCLVDRANTFRDGRLRGLDHSRGLAAPLRYLVPEQRCAARSIVVISALVKALPPSLVARALAPPRPRAKLLLTHDPSWHLAFLVCSRLWKSSKSWLLSHQQSRGRAAPGSSGASAGEARRAPRERDGALIEVSLVTGCSPGPPSPGGVSRRSRGVVSSETGNIWW